ncbi:uncharacterized protein LOC114520930 [Dendronephthya gigantea]|uniref:uncharacterized protein LOC114520930 n=1 Tax=Dendronephthya gigantea TaxID=151771 RepID=UPI00106CF3E0|nr:uncharacterized protein LOC114520930 [Dendronephthya gigantea]
MEVKSFLKEELNFFQFASIVFDEFPKMLRSTFVLLWDSKIAPLPGYQVWDDTPAVRTLLLTLEGGTTPIPTNKSIEDWDCTALFQANIYSKTFAISTTTTIKTLHDQFIKGKKPNPFHASLTSPTGNQDETITLAIDQIRLLRNNLCHLPKSSITKSDFDDYVELAKDAFVATGFSTDQVNYIGSLKEGHFPTERVNELNRKISFVVLENQKFLKGTLKTLSDGHESIIQKLDDINRNVMIIKKQTSGTECTTDEQGIRGLAAFGALLPNVSSDGGITTFKITARKLQVLKDTGIDSITLGEFFNACEKPLQDAVKRGFSDGRDDQKIGEIEKGCLVPLHCLTDERFLEVLDDFESGRLKERLLEEFSSIGVEIEGLEIEIKNVEEVNKAKEAIRKKSTVDKSASAMDDLSGETTSIGDSSGKTMDDPSLRAMDNLSDNIMGLSLGETKDEFCATMEDDSPGWTMDDATTKAMNEVSVEPLCVSTEKWEKGRYKEDVQKHIDKYGLSETDRFLKDKPEKLKHVEVNIGVAGDAGVGKSTSITTFIRSKRLTKEEINAKNREKWEQANKEDARKHIEKYGISGIENYFRDKLESEEWKDIEVNIAVTGNCCAGKSTFINKFRGLKKGDKGAAKTGVTETTREKTVYYHPNNNKIKFSDLPGLGTQNNPDFKTYCKDFELENCDTFLIFCKDCFTQNNRLLAEKVKELGKPFFFIRTHIDVDYENEVKGDDEEYDDVDGKKEKAMLEKITKYCLVNLKDLGASQKNVFLISNRHQDKWDFGRLTQAILDAIPQLQRESLTLSLTSLSKDLIKRKVKILAGKIWMVAAASGVGALVQVPEFSFTLDIALLTNEVWKYKSHLGVPDETAPEFKLVKRRRTQEIVRMLFSSSAEEISKLMKVYCAGSTVEEFAPYIPFVGSAIAASISFGCTYKFLHGCLNELENAALNYLDTMKLEKQKRHSKGDRTRDD